MNTDRDALRQAHPGKDWIDVGKPLPIGLRVATLMPRAMLSTWLRTI
jgi:hypothetical protein